MVSRVSSQNGSSRRSGILSRDSTNSRRYRIVEPAHARHPSRRIVREIGAPVEDLARRYCTMLEQCVRSLGAQKANLWVVSPGALQAQELSPKATGLWAFARTLANEVAEFERAPRRRRSGFAGGDDCRAFERALALWPSDGNRNRHRAACNARVARRPFRCAIAWKCCCRGAFSNAARAPVSIGAFLDAGATRGACRRRGRDRGRGDRPQFPRRDVGAWPPAGRNSGRRICRPHARPGMRRPGRCASARASTDSRPATASWLSRVGLRDPAVPARVVARIPEGVASKPRRPFRSPS